MKYRFEATHLNSLFAALQNQGYATIAPRISNHSIIYDEVTTADELPVGWTDVQEKGQYRLQKRQDSAYFGYNPGAHSWRRFLDPPERKLWSAEKQQTGIILSTAEDTTRPMAFIGVRSCELHAIAIQDRVYIQDTYQDEFYKKQREKVFIVAVNCVEAGNNCFCVSMSTGPQVEGGYDLVLTEVISGTEHYFTLEAGSQSGQRTLSKEVLAALDCRQAKESDEKTAQAGIENARQNMGRSLDADNIKELISNNYEHSFWEEVADKCLSCANCTMVCPTCFCSSVEDVTDLSGDHSERWQKWDSCFTSDFSYIHGGRVRHSTKSRYRQWMAHKLSTWQDQFDSSGCVGCGRCISWCPVGIDITESAIKLQEKENEKNN